MAAKSNSGKSGGSSKASKANKGTKGGKPFPGAAPPFKKSGVGPTSIKSGGASNGSSPGVSVGITIGKPGVSRQGKPSKAGSQMNGPEVDGGI